MKWHWRWVLSLVAVAVLAGCAKTPYYHPEWGPEKADREFADCQLRAENAAHNAGNVFLVERYMRLCLESKGFEEGEGG